MAKRNDDAIVTKPLPSTRGPWLVVCLLLTCLVLVYMGFLRTPQQLLGPPLPDNEYLPMMVREKPKPANTPAVLPAPAVLPTVPASAAHPATPAPAAHVPAVLHPTSSAPAAPPAVHEHAAPAPLNVPTAPPVPVRPTTPVGPAPGG